MLALLKVLALGNQDREVGRVKSWPRSSHACAPSVRQPNGRQADPAPGPAYSDAEQVLAAIHDYIADGDGNCSRCWHVGCWARD